jgi:hypothetical protein
MAISYNVPWKTSALERKTYFHFIRLIGRIINDDGIIVNWEMRDCLSREALTRNERKMQFFAFFSRFSS